MKIENIYPFMLVDAAMIDEHGNKMETTAAENQIATMIVRVVYSLVEGESAFGNLDCILATPLGDIAARVAGEFVGKTGPGVFFALIPLPAFVVGGLTYDIAVKFAHQNGETISAVARIENLRLS